MKIALGSDHGGFALKEHLRDFIRKEFGYDVVDFGTHSTEAVDYPDFAFLVAAAVAEGDAGKAVLEKLEVRSPLRRIGTPQDVAHAVAFLASESASFITGQSLVVDGGATGLLGTEI